MPQKFSLLIATVAAAAAVPPIISYVPEVIPHFSLPLEVESTEPVITEYQPVVYANSVNQVKQSNQQQLARMANNRRNSSGQIHQVGFTPSNNPQPNPQPQDYAPAEPLASNPYTSSTSTGGQTERYNTVGQGNYTVASSGTSSGNITTETPIVYMQPISDGASASSFTGFEPFFRFDISPSWVEQNWDFVTACVGPMNLQGYRVALVTGSSPDDLTGVITYYFDNRKKLQQIGFQGTTGDLGRLTAMLNSHFKMGQKLVNDPSLTIYETPASLHGPKNLMEARSPMVIKADQRYHRFEVYLLLSRPAEKTGLLW